MKRSDLPGQTSFDFSPRSSGRRNLVIEAGAGTGKTTRIVREVVELLLENPELEPERIALVTFTEKAAAEIADRVRSAITDLHASFDGPRPSWPSESERPILLVPADRSERWRVACAKQIDRLDRFRSQTIHSFCQNILRAHPMAAGLDPQFAIIQGFDLVRLQDKAWNEFIDSEVSEKSSPARVDQWRTLFHHFFTLQELRGAVFDIIPKRDLLADRSYSLGELSEMEADVLPALELVRRMPSVDFDALTDPSAIDLVGYLRSAATPAEGSISSWLAMLDPVRDLLQDVNLTRLKKFKTPLEPFTGPSGDRIGLHMRLSRHLAAQALRDVALRFAEHLDGVKSAEGVVDFDDLLILTADLLMNDEVAGDVRDRFDHIFVDEFQDTDRLQARILDRLARDSQGTILEGRTVIVGDPKQSIYSFRRADPETYQSTVATLIDSGASAEVLSGQYRSDPALVRDLNTMFGTLFSRPSSVNVARPLYEPLTAARPPSAGRTDGRITVIRPSATRGPVAIDDAYEEQAAAAAEWILARRAEDGVPYRDFALLLRRRTPLPEYLRIFGLYGIPSVLPPTRLFLDQPASVDLVSVLRAIASPRDRGALVGAARTPYFALTDPEIAAGLLGDGESWKAFRSSIEAFGSDSRHWPLSQLVDRLLDSRQIEEFYAQDAPGDNVLHLERLRDIAAEFDINSGGDVAQFVAEMDRRRAEADEADPSWVDDATDAVRILTIHASKGLEFGRVILPDLLTRGAGEGTRSYAIEEPKTLLFKGKMDSLASRFRSSDGVPLREIVSQRDSAELDRLFYVAVTRAREEVCFVFDRRKPTRAGFGAPLAACLGLESLPPLWDGHTGGSSTETFTTAAGTITVAREEFALMIESGEAEAGLATEIAAPLEPLVPYEPQQTSLPRGEIARRIAGEANRGAGTLVHRFLELWDGVAATLVPLVEKIAAEQASSSDELETLMQRATGLSRSPVMQRLHTAVEIGRELPVYWTDDRGVAIASRIDLLVRERGQLLVVDYKSGRLDPERRAHDEEQVARYQQAIALLAGSPCGGLLWYLDSDEVVEL